MIVYISGAITGKPDDNRPAFRDASSRITNIKQMSHLKKLKIANPIHIASRLRKSFSTRGKGDPKWEDYMRACIQKLCEADLVYFLPDWAHSEGASLERHIAKRLGIPCVDSVKELIKTIGELYEN
jgi:hypothetical protein